MPFHSVWTAPCCQLSQLVSSACSLCFPKERLIRKTRWYEGHDFSDFFSPDFMFFLSEFSFFQMCKYLLRYLSQDELKVRQIARTHTNIYSFLVTWVLCCVLRIVFITVSFFIMICTVIINCIYLSQIISKVILFQISYLHFQLRNLTSHIYRDITSYYHQSSTIKIGIILNIPYHVAFVMFMLIMST